MGKCFRVGVIGVGSIAQISHLPILSARDDVELVGVMAQHRKNAEQALRQYSFSNAVDTLDELIRLDLDCAFVLSPKMYHAQQVIQLLSAGIDVFCEKPMGMTLKEAGNMADAAVKFGKTLMIGFNRRFAPVYQQAKAAFADGKPDVIVAQKNRPASEYRATLENAIHMVDLLRYYGGECTRVDAHSIYTDPNYEILTTAQLQFENGTVGMLVADRACGQWMETLEMHGCNKSVFVNAPDSITVTDAQQSHATTMTPLAMGWARVEDKMGFAAEDEHFFNCLKTGRVPLTNAADAFKTHELMDKILRSAGLPDLSTL